MSLRTVRSTVIVAVTIVWAFVAPFSALGNTNLGLRYALVALSLVILTGWVGQISLAQASFVGIGAYITGVAVRSFGVPFPLTLVVSALVAGGAAALLGLVALRVRGLYLAVATLIFAWMTQAYLFNQPWLAGAGGSSSAEIPALGREGTFPYLDFSDRRTFYFLLAATVLAAALAAANVRDSKTGRAWFAVKGSEVAAASLGIDVVRYKLLAFASSGLIAGVAGGLIYTHESVATSTAFGPNVSLFFLSVAVVGGLASIGGAVASGFLFAGLEELFFRFEALAGSIEIVSAALLAIVLLFFPAGLAGMPPRIGALAGQLGLSFEGRSIVRLWGSIFGLRRSDSEAGDGNVPEHDTAGAASDEEPDEQMPPSWTARATGAIGRLLRRESPQGDPEDDQESQDVLAAALEELEEDEDEPDEIEVEESVRLLTYVPGTASKLKLPPRSRRRTVVTAQDITVQFGGLRAVDDFSLDVREGEIVGLMGPNGAGKTTLFNAISGLNEPTTGTVELYGRDVTKLPVHERARRGMGRTFQAIQLFSQLTVFDNLMVATHHRNASTFVGHLAATPMAVESEAAARSRVRQVIHLIGLEEFSDRSVAGLPFGVLRLVELARALVTGAPFVMLDEPASGLDNSETDRFMDLLLWARERLGITMLLIEHDVRMVTTLSDHIYVIDRGKRIADGTPTAIQRDPAVIAAYLGAAPDAVGAAKPDTGGTPRRSRRSAQKSATGGR